MSDRSYLRWPFFEERHRALELRASSWARRELTPPDESGDVDAQCVALVRALGDGGWLAHAVPPDGAPLDVRSLCLMRETLSYHSGLADHAFALQGLGTGAISLFGSPALRARYLGPARAGKAVAALALSEPEAGSDLRAMRTTARRDGNDYVIDGRKTWISNAGIAAHYVVVCRLPEGGDRSFAALVVDAGAPGFSVSERIRVLAPHPLGTIEFRSCRVPATALLGEPGKGLAVAMATLDIFRSTVGAAALGLARRALDEALDWTTSREAFGGTLADLQLTQGRLADMALAVDASALMVYRAAWTRDAGAQRVTREAAMAKLHATEAAQRVVDDAVQLLGGRGVVHGSVGERLYREVRALRIYEGASEIQKLLIASHLIDAHRAAAVPGDAAVPPVPPVPPAPPAPPETPASRRA